MKTAKKPESRFKAGDSVVVSTLTVLTEYHGLAAKVRRVFWEKAGGGQPAGWVVVLDHKGPSGRLLTFWERYIEAA